ncbi:MAG TPA: NAD(P)/FAD-dependent oxidoreductase, partial [Thermotogota bacterium]|nr:NAD(P)/FAD-dependent oxidoreductase [Thermotogota bacterium]
DHSRNFSSRMSIELNFTSFENSGALEKDIINYAINNGKRTILSYFDNLGLPKRLVTTLLQLANINGSISLSQLSKETRRKISEQFTAFKVKIHALGNMNESMVTTGGIDLKEIKLSTMESKKLKGLYFCGEMIDIDGDTGGYNIQMCFSTGFIAGNAASKAG